MSLGFRYWSVAQVITLPVVAGYADGVEAACVERGQVAHHVAGRAGAVAHAHDLVGCAARFKAPLGQPGVAVEVLVQEEVAQHRHAQRGETSGDLGEPLGRHPVQSLHRVPPSR
jgi:hypothetical protein